jgi:hypothetical protein
MVIYLLMVVVSDGLLLLLLAILGLPLLVVAFRRQGTRVARLDNSFPPMESSRWLPLDRRGCHCDGSPSRQLHRR